jgi:hypothetical protein
MAVTNFSPLLGLALPTTGDLSGTWGTVVNTSITDLIDSAIAGTTTLSANADVTLTTTNGAANQARNAVILWTASNGATTRNITAPAQSKAYIVINAGTGSIVVRGSGPTTGVTVTAGYKALIAWNGSDFVKITGGPINLNSGDVTGILPIVNGGTGTSSTAYASLTTNVTGILPVANGGTGASSLTSNNVLVGNGTSAVQTVAPGTNGNVLTSNGTTWVSSASATGLPSQTGNAGKFLTTDGSTASWATTTSAAGGGIVINNDVISVNYTIASGTNGFSVGPMTISSGYAITVSSGQRWVVI